MECIQARRSICGKIVKILLHDDVAASGECGVLVSNQGSVRDGIAARILGAVHKTDEIAFVEVTESVDFVRGGNGVSLEFGAH